MSCVCFVFTQLLLHKRLDPYWGLGAQAEVEPAEKVQRFDYSVEMSEVGEACLAPPSCAVRRLAHVSAPSPGLGRNGFRGLDRSGEGIGNGLEAPKYVSHTSRHGSLLVLSVDSHHGMTASFLDTNLSKHVLFIIVE